MTEQQDRLNHLYGRMNQIMSTKTWLDSDGKIVQAEIDELEREMQASHKLTPEQQAQLERVCEDCG